MRDITTVKKYEKVEHRYEIGEKLKNLNGSEYLVLDKFSEENLLLMNLKTGSLVISLGTCTYDRYPKYEMKSSANTEKGIEWNYGIYPEGTISQLDYESLRKEYSEMKNEPSFIQNGRSIYQIEITETLKRTIDIPARTLDAALETAQDMYDKEEIVLTADDFAEMSMKQSNERKNERERCR